jgi:lysozyme family protein
MATGTQRLFLTPRNQIQVVPLDTSYGDTRDYIYPFTIAYETGGDVVGGGAHEDPDDPGGFTKFGVAQEYHKGTDVKALGLAEALRIYDVDFWDGMHISRIQGPLAQAAFFDMAMNTPRGAAAVAQRIVRDTGEGIFSSFPLDERVGPKTLEAINSYIETHGEERFVSEFNDGRRRRARVSSKPKHRSGILNRVDDLEAYLVSRPFRPGDRTRSGINERFLKYLEGTPGWSFSDLDLLQ